MKEPNVKCYCISLQVISHDNVTEHSVTCTEHPNLNNLRGSQVGRLVVYGISTGNDVSG